MASSDPLAQGKFDGLGLAYEAENMPNDQKKNFSNPSPIPILLQPLKGPGGYHCRESGLRVHNSFQALGKNSEKSLAKTSRKDGLGAKVGV